MLPAGNTAKRLSLVNHATKNHHHRHCNRNLNLDGRIEARQTQTPGVSLSTE